MLRSLWRHPGVLAVAVSLLTVALLSAWAAMQVDASNMLASVSLGQRATIEVELEQAPRDWRLELIMRSDGPPATAWHIREQGQQDQGWLLSYQAGDQQNGKRGGGRLQCYRLGEAGMRLGAVDLDEHPRQVSWERDQGMLRLRIDGTVVLRSWDPHPHPAARAWHFSAPSSVSGSLLVYHLDRDPGEIPQQGVRSIRNQLQQALASGDVETLKSLRTRVEALGTHDPEQAILMSYLVVGLVSLGEHASLLNDVSPEGASTSPAPLPGLLLHLVETLSHHALSLPPGVEAMPISDIFDWRDRHIDRLLVACRSCRQVLAQEASHHQLELHLLDFTMHLAERLRGRHRDTAAPAKAPDWLSAQWRLVTLGPENPEGTDPPTIPWVDHPASTRSLNTAVQTLINALQPHSLRSAHSTRLVREALQNEDREALNIALGRVEGRAHALIHAMVSCTHPEMLDPSASYLALREGIKQSDSELYGDPLAYALWRLIATRHPEAAVLEEDSGEQLPEALEAWTQVLSGKPSALFTIYARPQQLPPAQALTTALAMQEARGGQADWGLLSRLPLIDLPLDVFVPIQ